MATYDEYLAQISQARTDIGQRIAGMPQFSTNLSEQVYGKEGALPSLRTQASEKVRALYDTDKRMADRYANPASEMYMKDPYARRKLTSAQHQQGMTEIQNLNNMIANRQDVLGSAIEKGLEIYKAGIDAQKFEYQGLMDELNMKMKIDSARASSSGAAAKKYPRFTEIVDQALSNAPTTPGTQIGEQSNVKGFNYQWNGQNWYPSDFGTAGQLEGMYNLALQNEYFDRQYGAEVYPSFAFQEPKAQTQWQAQQAQDAFVQGIRNQVISEGMNKPAAEVVNQIKNVYGGDLTTDELTDLIDYVYLIKGEMKPLTFQ
jgi:hypothetical protein